LSARAFDAADGRGSQGNSAVAGCTTSGGVPESVVDGMNFGFPVVISGCVSDPSQSPHDACLFDIEKNYGDVVTSEQILAWSSAASGVSPRQSL